MSKIQKVAVIGTGLMGTGIAEVCARAGIETLLVRATGGDPEKGRARVQTSLEKQVKRGKLTEVEMESALKNLRVSNQVADVSHCQLIVESIVEELDVKKELFKNLTKHCNAILASNTSTLKISELVPEGREDRTVGLHFFSPVPAMELVELVTLPGTDSQVAAELQDFCATLGKTVVHVQDSSGFVVNRLLVPYLLSAIAAFEGGLAPANQIDTAMKLGCAHPMGPLALADLIGLDIVLSMAQLLRTEFGETYYAIPPLLEKLVDRGWLGRKSKLGIYDYSERPAVENTKLR